MSAWPKGELNKIAGTDDLHISPFRDDGKTYGTPTWIWSVAVGDAPAEHLGARDDYPGAQAHTQLGSRLRGSRVRPRALVIV